MMFKDMKLFLIVVGISVLLLVGLAFLSKGSSAEEPVISGPAQGIEASPEFYELGNVPINGGLVVKEYEIKNTTDREVNLKKIVTSCMCTKAAFEVAGQKTKFFGMEGMGDRNPGVNVKIGPGQSGKVEVRFDPAAHGPQGVGPIDRSVYLTFSDPAGVKELKFKGVVVN
jgi:hypothetical protein